MDMTDKSVAALNEAVAAAAAVPKAAGHLSFLGRPSDCNLAVQDLQSKLEVSHASLKGRL